MTWCERLLKGRTLAPRLALERLTAASSTSLRAAVVPARRRVGGVQEDYLSPSFSFARSSTAWGMRVSKSWIFTQVGVTSIRVISS
jgi:hypothetical protein